MAQYALDCSLTLALAEGSFVRLKHATLLGDIRLVGPGETSEIIQYIGNQRLSARILRGRSGCENVEEVAGLLGRISPGRRRQSDKLRFQRLLARTQLFLIGLDFRDQATDRGFLLGHHSTVLIKLDSSICHARERSCLMDRGRRMNASSQIAQP